MEFKDLIMQYDELQKQYGDKNLHAIYNGGCEKNPEICFVFMNPTAKNIASTNEWKGRRSPWIGTKNIWKLFYSLGLLKESIYTEIQERKADHWDENFAEEVYQEVNKHRFFITNLGKCTQIDSRPIPNQVYKQYLNLLYQEIALISPKKIILFGNQVSSIFLEQTICVSECRKKKFEIEIQGKIYDSYPVYYPIGNGMRNIDKAIEDIKFIMGQNEKKTIDRINNK